MARASTTSDVFNAIAEPRRRQIIDLLAQRGSLGVGAIVGVLGMAQPAVSKHLGVLREVGVVVAERFGQHRVYRLEPEGLMPVHAWSRQFEHLWSGQLARIKERAERRAREQADRDHPAGKG